MPLTLQCSIVGASSLDSARHASHPGGLAHFEFVLRRFSAFHDRVSRLRCGRYGGGR